MKFINILTSISVVAALSACAPTRAQYDALQTTLEGSPQVRAQAIADCTKRHWSSERTGNLAKLMNVREKQAKSTFCNRLHGGLASGRITYEDVKSVWSTPTPNMIRVMQGR
ncbi:hypothetical protein GCM10010924_29930 [Rhizobium wenxiniae]|uniref:Lipoprotein n=1 Tax=Rhizobium wenxiniae TaxID=1737357 RepID=A0A7W9Y5D3_9HYPH|nr:hypothetical protein [Rhizobium wenxiniae]MBB6162299.1 hypothetical protein [Rhizobium wenxiniae]GGF99692.1 hypothetical protein GCM10010924_29930 [Rhizobium wenxiniae]